MLNTKKNILYIFILFILLYLNLQFHNKLLQKIHRISYQTFIDSSFYFYDVLNIKYFLVAFCIFIVFSIFSYQKLHWKEFDNYKVLRLFVFILSFAIFWEQGFLDYNYFIDSDIRLDKFLLLLFFIGILYHPLFVLPFLFQSLIILKSNVYPLDNFPWTGIRPSYEILILFISFIVIKRFKDINTNIFIILAIALHTSNYFIPGIAKIEISPNGYEWTFFNEINNLFISGYVNGWLGFIQEEYIIKVASFIDKIDFLITISTMIIQVGALFLLYKKRVSILFFIGFEILHIGIFLASGIFFWSWIIVNLGFIYFVTKMSEDNLKLLYTKQNFYLFVLIVLLSPYFYKPIALGWWDGRVNSIYEFYALQENGDIIKLNRNDFSPQDMKFSQGRFYYIDKNKISHNTFGNIARDDMKYADTFKTKRTNDSYELYLAYENARSIDEIQVINKKFGKTFYNEKIKNNLENFIKTYFENYNKVEQKHSWYHKLGAPYHIYDFSAKRLKGGEKIKKVEVYKTNIWWNKEEGKIVRFGEEKVMEVEIETN